MHDLRYQLDAVLGSREVNRARDGIVRFPFGALYKIRVASALAKLAPNHHHLDRDICESIHVANNGRWRSRCGGPPAHVR